MLDSMIFAYMATGSIAVLISIWFAWRIFTSRYSFIYCPFNVPLFGSTLQLEYEPEKFKRQMDRLILKAKHLVLLWFSFKALIYGATVEYSKAVLSSQRLMRKSYFYDFLHEWLGTGLLTSYGKKWKTRRKMITPSFHFSILNRFAEIFQKHAQILVDRIVTSANSEGAINVQEVISLAKLEAMCEASMGVNVSGQEAGKKYVQAVGSLNQQLQRRQRTPYLWPYLIYRHTSYGKIYYESLKYVQKYTTDVINRKITEQTEKSTVKSNFPLTSERSYQAGDKKGICFIDILLSSYQTGEIDIDGIREEVDTFIFEGHDTTASAISFCLYLLGRHPEHQKSLQDEIQNVEGKDVFEKVKNMKFLDLCLKEALRLYPPVPLIARELEEDTVIDGHKIYKNTDVVVAILWLHRNEKYWEEPIKFDPYRFTQKNLEERDPFSYVPFSAGPRNCIGQRFALLEAKIYIFYVLKNFNLRSSQKEDDIELCMEIIMKSKNGLMIDFEVSS